MKYPCFNLLLCASVLLVSPSALAGNTTKSNSPSDASPKAKSYFFSSLLPTALQSHPLLAISVPPETTDFWEKLSPPTAEKPAYYQITCMDYHHEGQGVDGSGKFSVENLEKLVRTALSNNHYLPADKDHSPTLALFYFWGVHSKLDDPDKEMGAASGSPFLGRDMSAPLVDKRINRKGNVGMGELKVIEMDQKNPEKSDATAGKNKKPLGAL